VRRTTDKVSLLTVGNVTYSGDPRIKVIFQYPNNWRLHINPINNEDAGLYMCQVSTHPPRVFATNLTVLGKYILNGVKTVGERMPSSGFQKPLNFFFSLSLKKVNISPSLTFLTPKNFYLKPHF
jgi:hypothetical protein